MSQEERAGAAEADAPQAAPASPKAEAVPAASKPVAVKSEPAPPKAVAAVKPAPAKPPAAKPIAAVKPTAPAAATPAPAAPAAEPEPNATSAADVARSVRRKRARRLFLALAFWVGVPTLLGVVYYGFLAQAEFESVATLVLTGSPESAEQNAVLLREHLLSRDLLAKLESTSRFTEHYRSGSFVSRLPTRAGTETRYKFFRGHVDAHYEPKEHVFTLRVRAYSGEAARSFASRMVALGTDFVGSVSPAQGRWFVLAAAPSLPDEPSRPQRAYGMLTVLVASFALFGIGSLLIAAIREHAQF